MSPTLHTASMETCSEHCWPGFMGAHLYPVTRTMVRQCPQLQG